MYECGCMYLRFDCRHLEFRRDFGVCYIDNDKDLLEFTQQNTLHATLFIERISRAALIHSWGPMPEGPGAPSRPLDAGVLGPPPTFFGILYCCRLQTSFRALRIAGINFEYSIFILTFYLCELNASSFLLNGRGLCLQTLHSLHTYYMLI